MSDGALSYLTPEARARIRIDEMLGRAGWDVPSWRQANLAAERGVAIREFVLEPPHGRVEPAFTGRPVRQDTGDETANLLGGRNPRRLGDPVDDPQARVAHRNSEGPMNIARPAQPLSLAELRIQRSTILNLAAKRGASNVRVFGSVVRGDATATSDVDFLVDMEPRRSLLDLGGLLMDLAEMLDRDVDVVTEQGLRERLRQRVLAEAVLL